MDIDIKLKKFKKFLLLFSIVLITYWTIKSILHYENSKVPLPNVIIEHPRSKKVTEYVTQTGTAVAYQSVDLVARVEGFLEKQNFIDGSFVNPGHELFLIEQNTYLEKLKGAKAEVRSKKAAYKYAVIEHERQKKMLEKNATSLNNVQLWEARRDEAKAGVDKAISDAHIAAINYNYTKVVAPFYGRIGRHLVNVGNLVGHNEATKLATIDVIDPIYVYFNLNEIDLIKIRAIARKANFNPENLDLIPVEIRTQNEHKFIHKGVMNFVNTGLNASTGTLEFRGLLANKDYDLLPGLFVEVRIPITDPIDRLVVPDYVILYDQIGPYVLITNPQNIVEIKRVILGSVNNGRRVIISGLSITDNVIVSGMHNATPGKQVAPISRGFNKK